MACDELTHRSFFLPQRSRAMARARQVKRGEEQEEEEAGEQQVLLGGPPHGMRHTHRKRERERERNRGVLIWI